MKFEIDFTKINLSLRPPVKENQWDLTPIYPNLKAWKQDYDSHLAIFQEILGLQEKVKALDITAIVNFLELKLQCNQIFQKLEIYLELWHNLQPRKQVLEQLLNDFANVEEQEDLQIDEMAQVFGSLNEEQIKTIQTTSPQVNRELSRHLKNVKNKLSPEIEAVVGAAENALTLYSHIYDAQITEDQVWQKFTHKNRCFRLNNDALNSLLSHQSRPLRLKAEAKLLKAVKSTAYTRAATLEGYVRSELFSAKARKYGSSLEASLSDECVPTDIYTKALAAVNQNLPLLRKFINLKQKLLKVKNFNLSDVGLPLKDSNNTISYTQAQSLIPQVLKPLGPEYGYRLQEKFNRKQIDVFPRKGKEGSAYEIGTHGTPSYVLINYRNRFQDTVDLIHELGHSMHTELAFNNQPYGAHNYSLMLAEIASLTNENLFLKHLINKATTKKERLIYLEKFCSSFYGYVYHQSLYSEFELEVHQLVAEDKLVNVEVLNTLWISLHKKYYGPKVKLNKNEAYGWAEIPHFFSSFYLYQYIVGFAVGCEFAQQILTQGPRSYLELLKSGDKNDPIPLLKEAGIDVESPTFMQYGFNCFAQALDEIEVLLKK